LKPKFWFQTKLKLRSPVSNQTIVMYFDIGSIVTTLRDKTLVSNRITLSFVSVVNFGLKPADLIRTRAKTGF